MKKNLKYFLVGAGAVVAGFFAYELLKDRPEDDIIAEPAEDTVPQRASSEQHISQEYIERRRELYRKRAAERAVAATTSEDSLVSSAISREDSTQATQETPKEKVVNPDGSTQYPNGNIDSDADGETPADFPEDGDSAPTGASSEGTSSDGTDKSADVGEVSPESEGQEKLEK